MIAEKNWFYKTSDWTNLSIERTNLFFLRTNLFFYWLIFRPNKKWGVPYFVLNCSLFRSFIYIYAYTGFVGLSPNGQAAPLTRRFERKNKLLNNWFSKKRDCSINKRNCFNQNKNYSSKIQLPMPPTPQTHNAFRGNGNSICYF